VLGVLSARVGSVSDNRMGGWHAYRASKAALNQLVRGTAIELARSRPDAVAPRSTLARWPPPSPQAYAPPYEKLAPEEAARRLLAVLDGLTPAETGRFWDHEGREVPW
jgi:NAD(P)-dependent dehydrogenase (short-subunit alcohol dehydrogenase family)